ncbi:hypothetical protein SEMRO_2134_G315920.1 [Seminavis robusta]|uniref:Uncharacterized protein n=1 Tax=Seminavis robusta TaxID=568900 RepID=A0A9N8HW53_9STRA|nr:hypothetical protein SEMRO_2134_G315920.1 [Seminavis robusta]|eukprot:Sro2134_g315920.1 n/a (111) ;mRNA; f:5014-5346
MSHYSSSCMHITISHGTTNGAKLETLSERDIGKLYTAIEKGIELGLDKDTKMDVAFCSNVHFPDEKVLDVVTFLEKHESVLSVVEAAHDLIIFKTTTELVVTIRFHGSKK